MIIYIILYISYFQVLRGKEIDKNLIDQDHYEFMQNLFQNEMNYTDNHLKDTVIFNRN